MKYPNITTLNECFLSKKHKRRQIQQLKGSWFFTRCNATQIYPTASNVTCSLDAVLHVNILRSSRTKTAITAQLS